MLVTLRHPHRRVKRRDVVGRCIGRPAGSPRRVDDRCPANLDLLQGQRRLRDRWVQPNGHFRKLDRTAASGRQFALAKVCSGHLGRMAAFGLSNRKRGWLMTTLKRHSDVRTRCQEAVTWSAVQACTSFSPSIRASQRDRITQRPRKRPADAAQSIFIFNRLFSSR